MGRASALPQKISDVFNIIRFSHETSNISAPPKTDVFFLFSPPCTLFFVAQAPFICIYEPSYPFPWQGQEGMTFPNNKKKIL